VVVIGMPKMMTGTSGLAGTARAGEVARGAVWACTATVAVEAGTVAAAVVTVIVTVVVAVA
jgi:hypothetical protein